MKIAIINGPNLNLLGTREPNMYGNQSFGTFLEELKIKYNSIVIDYFQSNIEGELINKIQECGLSHNGILLNAGGYTHTSVAIGDAIAAISIPVVEIHITNPVARESFRSINYISSVCKGSISGFGLHSYVLGIEWFLLKNEV